MGVLPQIFYFACTTTNIAAASASSAAFITVTDWNSYDGFFASAMTCKAGSRSLPVAFRAQYFVWHHSPPTFRARQQYHQLPNLSLNLWPRGRMRVPPRLWQATSFTTSPKTI
jgi:hypothetical protein